MTKDLLCGCGLPSQGLGMLTCLALAIMLLMNLNWMGSGGSATECAGVWGLNTRGNFVEEDDASQIFGGAVLNFVSEETLDVVNEFVWMSQMSVSEYVMGVEWLDVDDKLRLVKWIEKISGWIQNVIWRVQFVAQ